MIQESLNIGKKALFSIGAVSGKLVSDIGKASVGALDRSMEIIPHLTKYSEERWGKTAFKGKVNAGIVAGAAIMGIPAAHKTYQRNQTGYTENGMVSPTPQLETTMFDFEKANASGDLVFALNNNRRG